ncbi:MAG: TSUP family transporter, partial [Candidatus Nanopelagicales bacterium]
MLLPAFAIFLPISLAIVATAVVHLTNNFFKLFITYKDINYRIFLLFGIPAGLASLLGAYFLVILEGFEQTIAWQIKEFNFETTLIKLIIGLLIIFFALFELITSFKNITFATKLIPVGGAISGFFGGLSGHQGALRSAFL